MIESEQKQNQEIIRVIWLLLGATITPLLAMYSFLVTSRTMMIKMDWDYLAFVICLVIGLIFVIRLPWENKFRLMLSMIYLPLMTLALFMFSVNYVCVCFDNCL